MRSFYFLLLIIISTSLQSKAGITTNWTGHGSGLGGGTDVNNWFNSNNWDNGVPGSADIAQIGVVSSYTNSPVISTTTTITTLNFGALSSGSLTINSGVLLTVTGNITVQYSSVPQSATINILQTISSGIGGKIRCKGSFFVGDGTTQPVFSIFYLYLNNVNTMTVNLNIQNFIVDNNLTLSTTSSPTTTSGSASSANINNSVLNVNNGTLTVTGNISTVNTGGHVSYAGFTIALLTLPLATYPAIASKAQLLMNPATGNSATLGVGGTITGISGDVVDLYVPSGGTCTTNYKGTTAQTVYSTSNTLLDASPSLYQNLTITGTGAKNLQTGSITVNGNWTSSGGLISPSSTNTTTFQRSGAQSLSDTSSHGGTGVIFQNLTFKGSGTKSMALGNFSVASTGVLTMADTAALAINSFLILKSDISGTATVAPLARGTSITGSSATGNVKSQRFFKGSDDITGTYNLSKRGYRLISSPLYTYQSGGVNYFDLKYLLDSAYVSGAAGGGFNVPTTTNPSLYLFREDVSASNTNFTTGNWKGIAKINNANAYDIGTQKRATLTNTADTTINLGVGNGVMFFFRGNQTNNPSQSGTKVTAPYDYPEDVVFTQTGQLNTGAITVKQWYYSTATPGFSYTSPPTVKDTTERGYVFVGNPYASTINFEKFNRNGSNSPIYGSGFPAATTTPNKIWIYNPSTKQYETYMQSSSLTANTDTTITVRPTNSMWTGDATNMIASGQGFFMRTKGTGSSLTFRENAKTLTQPPSTNINRIMSVPANNTQAFSSLPTTINTSPLLAILNFRLVMDSINTDDAVLAFNNKTSAAFNDDDDAEDMNGNSPLVSLSVMSSDSIATAIKQVKLPTAGQQQMRLLVNAAASGTYHLTLRSMTNMPDAYDVWLMDNFKKDSLDLKHNSNYDFDIDKTNAATYGTGRFSVVVRLNPAEMMHTLSTAVAKTIQGAQVSWRTENEGTDFVFSVEKSLDGKSFTQIGQLNSNGSGNYAYTDVVPNKGMNYYKVQLQDIALSTISYSSVMSLNYADATTSSTASNISVYPNPATSTVNIKMTNSDSETDSYSITISNSTGRLVKQLKSATPSLQTNISDFLPGTYMVQIVNLTDNKLQGQTKFVKL